MTIGDLVAELLVHPKIVLCLDTCDLLDAIRGIKMGNLAGLRSLIRILDEVESETNRCRVVTTYLVEHEWRQNWSKVRVDQLADLKATSERLTLINQARDLLNQPALRFPEIDGTRLIDDFIAATRTLIDRAVVLERDQACIDRALERLMDQRRPSHKNQIKDSIHLEHYLELARQLKGSAYGKPCLFASGNKADFWAEAGEPRVHPDLERDLTDAGLTFFPRLENAVRSLGI